MRLNRWLLLPQMRTQSATQDPLPLLLAQGWMRSAKWCLSRFIEYGAGALVHEALHEAEQVAVVVPDVHLGDHAAVLVAGGGALLDERLQGVAAARQHRVAGRQRQRGAQIVGAVAAVHDALVGVLPPQVLQLLALHRRAHL